MQRGRGGMGSHKHGVSGHAKQSPKLRLARKIEAEAGSKRPKRAREQMKATVKELLHDPR